MYEFKLIYKEKMNTLLKKGKKFDDGIRSL